MAVQSKFATATDVIDEIVRRVVRHFAPDRIILFGSRATGKAEFDSDVDLLVAMRCAISPSEQAEDRRRAEPQVARLESLRRPPPSDHPATRRRQS